MPDLAAELARQLTEARTQRAAYRLLGPRGPLVADVLTDAIIQAETAKGPKEIAHALERLRGLR